VAGDEQSLGAPHHGAGHVEGGRDPVRAGHDEFLRISKRAERASSVDSRAVTMSLVTGWCRGQLVPVGGGGRHLGHQHPQVAFEAHQQHIELRPRLGLCSGDPEGRLGLIHRALASMTASSLRTRPP